MNPHYEVRKARPRRAEYAHLNRESHLLLSMFLVVL